MTDIKSIFTAEKECERKTKRIFKNGIDLYDELFTQYLKISEKYCRNGPQKNTERPLAILLLNDKIVKELYCISRLLRNGHYPESLSLQREVLEAICKVEYITKNPDASDSWLNGESMTFGKVSKKILLFPDDGEIFGHLSDFTHTNMRSTIGENELVESQMAMTYTFEPFFQRDIARASLAHIIQLTFRAMICYMDFIEKYHEDIEQSDKEKIRQITEKAVIISRFLVEKKDLQSDIEK
jgi:hypothetical protein